MSGNALLVLRDVSLGYRRQVVLSGINLTIAAGALVCLAGDNGSGKSTLLAALAGVMRPLSGMSKRQVPFSETGFIPQQPGPMPELPLTTREYVELGLAGIRAKAASTRIEEALASVGAGGLAESPFATLSGGQRRRAMAARALVRHPRLILADEPEAGLDSTTRKALAEVLVELNRSCGVTVVMATHDPAFAALTASRTLVVERGRVCEEDR